MNQAAMLADFVRHTDVDILMLAGRYTLLEQGALDELLPLCLEHGVGVVAAGVFNSGVLARDDPPDDAKYDYGEARRESVDRARRIAEICRRHGVSLPAAAIAFPAAPPGRRERVPRRPLPRAGQRETSSSTHAGPAGLWRSSERGPLPERAARPFDAVSVRTARSWSAHGCDECSRRSRAHSR